MWTSFIQTIAKILISPTIFLMGLAGYNTHVLSPDMAGYEQQYLENSQQSFGATLPFAGNTYNLAGAGISSSAASIILTSLTIKQTGQLIQTSDLVGTGGTFYVTVEPGSNTKQEIVACTGVTQNTSSATLTGCSRGMAPISPYTSSTTLSFVHAGGSQVIFSDPPQVFNLFYALANNATSTGILTFSSTTPPRYDSIGAQSTGTYIATTSEFASIAYVNATGAGVNVNGTSAVKGVYQSSTGAQASSGTSLGSTGASLALTSSIATSTCQVAQNSVLVASSTTGKLDAGCIATNGSLTYTGNNRSTASTTFTGGVDVGATSTSPLYLAGNKYTFPTTRGASSTALTENGSGALTWVNPFMKLLALSNANLNSQAGATTSMATVPIPANTITTTSQSLKVKAVWQTLGSNACGAQIVVGTGSASTTVAMVGLSATNYVMGVINLDIVATSTSAQFYTSQGYSMTDSGISAFANASSYQMIVGRAQSSYSFGSITYISFQTNGANCNLLNFEVDMLSL